MYADKNRKPVRLDMTSDEKATIRLAAALAGYRSMAEMARTILLEHAEQIVIQSGLKMSTTQPEKVLS